MTLLEYLQLVEWKGRQLYSGKRGRIISSIPLLLDRLGTTAEIWLAVVKKFERRQQVKLAAEGDKFAVGGWERGFNAGDVSRGARNPIVTGQPVGSADFLNGPR